MKSEELDLLGKRKAAFEQFYGELIPALVDFIEQMGVRPAHEVLNHAPQFVSFLTSALGKLTIESEQDRTWLLTRLGYFIGECLVQKYGGSWYVSEDERSKYFARYVVGRFSKLPNETRAVDPFEVARILVDAVPTRKLDDVLTELDAEFTTR